jgi:hypothetical protein
VPGIVSPCKITVKGAPAARRLLRNRRPLSSDLARQVLGTYRNDGAERGEIQEWKQELRYPGSVYRNTCCLKFSGQQIFPSATMVNDNIDESSDV